MDNLLHLVNGQLATWAAVALTTVFAIHFFVASQKSNTKRPPIVGYLVPWLGSAIAMGRDPDMFFRRARLVLYAIFTYLSNIFRGREQLGDVFGVRVAGKTHFHVTSASVSHSKLDSQGPT